MARGKSKRKKTPTIDTNDFSTPKLSVRLTAGLVAIALSAIAFLIWRAFDNPFVSDDFLHIVGASMLDSLPTLNEILNKSWTQQGPSWGYRPLLSLTYFLEKNLWGHTPGYMRIINIIIHLGNAALIVAISKSKMANAKHLFWIPTAVTLLYVFHPSVWHPVIYVSARSTLLVSHLILWTIFLYQCTGHKRWLFVVTAFMAVLTKETGLLAIPLAFLVNWSVFANDYKQYFVKSKYRWQLLTLSLAAVLAVMWFRRHLVVAYLFHPENFAHNVDVYVLSEFYAFWRYVELIILPIRWAFFHGVLLLTDPYSFLNICVYIFTLGFVYYSLKKAYKNKTVFFSLLAILLTVLPEFFFPRELLVIEQRCYLPISMTAILLLRLAGSETWVPWIVQRKKVFLGGIFTLLGLYGTLVYQRIDTYGAILTIMERDVAVAPHNIDSLSLTGQTHFERQNFNLAEEYFSKAFDGFRERASKSKRYREERDKVYHQLITLRLRLNRPEKARALLDKCDDYGIQRGRCYLLFAKYHNYQGQFEKALSLLEALPQDSYLVRPETIFALSGSGKIDQALAVARTYYDEQPYRIDAVASLLNILVKRQETAEAVKFLNHVFSTTNKYQMPEIETLRPVKQRLERQLTGRKQ
jgi:tetratricopeptide (TPR) repeat protein